ncbi:fluoride efflux transporter CrcB [Lysinibacillus sp. SGAir0095]|uniref:fluoride efflux transporter CrcB n=1 Tax=Lysinibacillus sp. SGAir0095 TaxID=2070463 RepID=UPI0010CD038E|nr:fluoride efflux transporter CrcB [Lysinibacillus sp. SGAir0095]QCR32777.1 fluoride efflux transporter CrcB [Lysinibacillus sp. SGAir0095]
MEWMMVSFGGGMGATLRYLVQLWIVKKRISSYWATALVNVFGSFMLGITSNIAVDSSTILAFFTVGILGAFTTFSTFAFDIVKLLEAKKYKLALLFVSVNLIGGFIGFSFGWLI